MTIHLISDLPRELEIQTCTCYRRPNYKNSFTFSNEWRRPIHSQCMKPTQDQVIYFCGICEEYFISKTLHPSSGTGHRYKIRSVIYIARAESGPEPMNWSIVEDVYCGKCC